MIKSIAFFCYPVSDIKRSRAFYEGFLGLKPNGEYDKAPDTTYVEYDIGSWTLAIGSHDSWPVAPDAGASAALEVDDFEAWVKKIQDAKVPIKAGPYDFPSCQMIVIHDPDKNKITLHRKKK